MLGEGHPPWLARFLAGRLEGPVTTDKLYRPRLAELPNPDAIPDMAVAVQRISDAILAGQRVLFCVDHDMDGQASAAVLWSAFVDFFAVAPERLSVLSSHRLLEGYGITDEVCDRILERAPDLVISADKGSSDEARIARIAAAGIDVIVTDHHAVPEEGPPASALACVNPTRRDSHFDPTICGAAVSFFCMARVRSELLARNPQAQIPPLGELLDYVAVATIADCVSLRPDRALINRTLVKYGLAAINRAQRPCWQVFLGEHEFVDSQAVAFSLAPAVAAAGRLDWAETGFRFLTAKSRAEAEEHWAQLQLENQERKTIEKRVRTAAEQQLAGADEAQGLVVFLEDGHAGVHGITASRLVERYGRPVAMLAPRGQGARDHQVDPASLLAGSLRGVEGLHLREALQWIADQDPGVLQRFGGHRGAAGLSLRRAHLARFRELFDVACRVQLGDADLRPVVWLDGELDAAQLSLDTVELFADLDPWGRDFPPPLFVGDFACEQVRPVGDGSHLQLRLRLMGDPTVHKAIWFFARENLDQPEPLQSGESARLCYSLSINSFRGRRDLQLQVRGRVTAHEAI